MLNRKQKIVPNLWFDREAEAAVNFYTSVFDNSSVNSQLKYSKVGQEIHGQEAGTVMSIGFQLEGCQMLALNGGPQFKFNPSISFFVLCKDEEEINRLWKELVEEGEVYMELDSYDWSSRYGWLQDRFGLHWQLMVATENSEQNIVPMLMFTGDSHGKAESAIRYYTSVFEDSNLEGILKYGEEDQNGYAMGAVKHAQFQLEGKTFMAMDSGVTHEFPFNESISFIVNCKDQKEIDSYWGKLTREGDPNAQQCGWLKDKFGISWQIIPEDIEKILNDPDKAKAHQAMEALLAMKKIDLAGLKNSGVSQ
ncbi:VOC family protein [Salinimicrobium marinum]|uniref:VOC family protein n=1 Tax=Salinimicrobium marinum TaxID=680283 RepID=A0A918VVJ4_9FLAO|nr:VOC family protein [Salinimicrobium marinum]GHA27178.1 VOC family protein [Salinimicrobium marinum]